MIVADAHRQRGVETPDQLDPKANRASPNISLPWTMPR